ncbi:DUF4350 domain-containing protein [Flavitalea flava]
MLLLSGCSDQSKRANPRVTLWRKDKIPYGTFFAFENLHQLFPNSTISINKNSPTTFLNGENKKAYIIISSMMDPDSSEMNAIMNFVGEGNHVFISAFGFGESFLHGLKIKKAYGQDFYKKKDSLRVSVYDPENRDSLSFVYPGNAMDDWASSIDSQYTSILGRDGKGRPDFVKLGYKGGGSIMLHFAPMALTNYFLLHKNNKAYYEQVMSYIPSSVTEVIWDDYFRYSEGGGQKSNFSALQYILKNASLSWAFGLLLLLFLLIYLFGTKRKQRIVPKIERLRNNSLDFVKTIGRLYYQRRDNHNLALKMVSHFQDHVRTRYNLSVNFSDPVTPVKYRNSETGPDISGSEPGDPDSRFVDQLSYKTGISKEFLQDLLEEMRGMQVNRPLTDAALLTFHRKLEEFYKQG